MYRKTQLRAQAPRTPDNVFTTEQYQQWEKQMSEGSEFRRALFTAEKNKPGNICWEWRVDKPDEMFLDRMPFSGTGTFKFPDWKQYIKSSKETGSKYTTYNLVYGDEGKRIEHNLRTVAALRAFYVDLDSHEISSSSKTMGEAADYLLRRMESEGMPLPFIVNSGRGLHLVWFIKEIVRGLKGRNIKVWREVENALIKYVNSIIQDEPIFTAWDVDKAVRDPARLMRIPGSYNHKAKRYCYVMFAPSENTTLEQMCELMDIDTKKLDIQNAPSLLNIGLSNLNNIIEALKQWVKNRLYNIKGYRNKFLTILMSFLTRNNRNTAEAVLRSVNNRLVEPLRDSEVGAICRTIFSLKAEKVYRYSFATVVNTLCMTAEERKIYSATATAGQKCANMSMYGLVKSMETGKDTRRPNRARDEKNAEKRKKKAAMYEGMRQMKRRGCSAAEIAEFYKVKIQTVYKHWNITDSQLEHLNSGIKECAIKTVDPKAIEKYLIEKIAAKTKRQKITRQQKAEKSVNILASSVREKNNDVVSIINLFMDPAKPRSQKQYNILDIYPDSEPEPSIPATFQIRQKCSINNIVIYAPSGAGVGGPKDMVMSYAPDISQNDSESFPKNSCDVLWKQACVSAQSFALGPALKTG